MTSADRRITKQAFACSIPVLMGYVAMGFAAGVLLVKQTEMDGAVFWGAVTSATCISGTLQFMLPGWFRDAAPLADVALLSFCINFRYAMYGFSLLEKFRGLPLAQRLYLIWTLTDETYALECAAPYPPGREHARYCLTLAALDHLYWVAGVTAGALTGANLPFSGQGIDFAMTALFLVILTDQLRDRTNRRPAAVGGLAALVTLFVFGPGNMLIPAIGLLLAVFLVCRGRWDTEAAK